MIRAMLAFAVLMLSSIPLLAQQIYFIDNNFDIAKISPESQKPITVYKNDDHAVSGFSTDRDAKWLYAMLNTEKLFRVRPEGSKMEVLAEFDTDPFGGAVISVAFDEANNVFYILGSTTIVRYFPETGELKPWVREADRYHLNPNQIALSDSFVYWSSRDDDLVNGVIRRIAKNGTRPETIVPKKYGKFVEGLAIVGENLYWIASPADRDDAFYSVIYNANADGSNPKIFYEPQNESASPANDLVYFQNHLYFDTLYDGIMRISPGGNAEPFVKVNFSIDYMLILP